MGNKRVPPGLPLLLVLTLCPVLLLASPPQAEVKKDATHWIIEGVGTETASPDVIYLMMKMESESSSATDAVSRGEKQLSEFLGAVDRLKISNLSYRVVNNLITSPPVPGSEFSGLVYTRNVVFTFLQPQPPKPPAELDATVAQLEDLGARYNSHCVTCIGSG